MHWQDDFPFEARRSRNSGSRTGCVGGWRPAPGLEARSDPARTRVRPRLASPALHWARSSGRHTPRQRLELSDPSSAGDRKTVEQKRPYTNSTFTRRPTIAAARCRLPSVMSLFGSSSRSTWVRLVFSSVAILFLVRGLPPPDHRAPLCFFLASRILSCSS